jgi:hypothetical protein
MAFFRAGFIAIFLIVSCLIAIAAVQSGPSDEVFTLVVAPPTSAKDVQFSYFVTVGHGGYGGGTVVGAHIAGIFVEGNKISFKTPAMSGQPAKTMKLLAYARGCEFLIMTVADLSNSTREADFHCQQLPTLQVRGRVDIHDFNNQDLEVEAQYWCRMAVPFPYPKESDVLPLNLGKATVASDGTFAMDVPDFVIDPSWPQVSTYASLGFALLDAKSGKRLAFLTSLAEPNTRGRVPVASRYPEISLTVYHPEAPQKREPSALSHGAKTPP